MMKQSVHSTVRCGRLVIAALALAHILIRSHALAQPVPSADADPILIENSIAQIRRSDYEAELLRLPPEARGGFATSERRVSDLLVRMLVTKTLAVQAGELGIDRDPEVRARLRNETERFLAQLRLARVEEEAGKEFDAKRATFEPRARELYLVDRKKFEISEQVSASHILFSNDKHAKDEGLRLAQDARARILAGADFHEVAKQISEDPTATANGGSLGWFGRGVMDPAFTDAAFTLQKEGDLSAPVLSRFGWHVIRLDGRRPAGIKPYEQVREQIVGEMRQKYIADNRDRYLVAIREDPKTSVHQGDVDALYVPPPDPETLKRLNTAPPPTPAVPTK
jgi:peptidyl-prolyl cis-trans isomerase C